MEVKASAPGKIILFGEHAVVYGRPAIAAPITQVRAYAHVTAGEGDEVQLFAPDLNKSYRLDRADTTDALVAVLHYLQKALRLDRFPPLTITVTSDIPIAGGLGSGAAITAAIVRAIATYLGHEDRLTAEWISNLTYEVEKIYHGSPSGIDNTVVAYEQAVYFRRAEPHNQIDPLRVGAPLHLLIGDTGVGSHTKEVVGDVRRRWKAASEKFERIFDGCGYIARTARAALEAGEVEKVGRLMTDNHQLLRAMTVSSPELDRLVTAALQAGALGAKLSGAGRGGNMIALVTAGRETAVAHALQAAGAAHILRSRLTPSSKINHG